MSNAKPCMSCDGEKVTDDNPDLTERAPWSFWQNLTPPSDMAVRLGWVKPMPCESCSGTGTEAAS